MWSSRKQSSNSGKSISRRILLAIRYRRRKEHSSDLRCVSAICIQTSCPSSRVILNTFGLSFAQWGLDMVGKLHKSWPGGHVYLLVAVNRLTKWVEAKP